MTSIASPERPDPRAEYIKGSDCTLASYTSGGRSGWEGRFWRKVEKADSCWIWRGARSGEGYGLMTIGGRRRLTHRLSWLLHEGPIPIDKHLDHLCRVRQCVNPAHLEVVTSRQNTMRGTNQVVRNAAVTQCPQGHPYDDANTYDIPTGGRACRECRRRQSREYQRKTRASRIGGI